MKSTIYFGLPQFKFMEPHISDMDDEQGYPHDKTAAPGTIGVCLHPLDPERSGQQTHR